VGETTCDPFNATVVPFRSALTALVVVQVRVELPPTAIVVGLPVIPAVGFPLVLTVTVAVEVAVAPEELFAMKVYVVVAVGETTCDPLTATEAPFRVALAALVDDQVRVELPPGEIVSGLAVMEAVGPPPEVTVMVIWPQSVLPFAPCAVMR
jgi:hypothetical protein